MRTSLIPIALLAMSIFIPPATCRGQQPVAPPISGNENENDQLCTIAGAVLSANTGEPLKKAHVDLHRRGDESDEHPFIASSDASGHFSIDKIPAGRYDLRVGRTNYLDTQYGQDQPDKPGAILSLAPGQKITDLLFRLHRTAVITGRVLDEDGDPVPGLLVHAALTIQVNGRPVVLGTSGGFTNNEGYFIVSELPGGRYYLSTEFVRNSREVSKPGHPETEEDFVHTEDPVPRDITNERSGSIKPETRWRAASACPARG